MKSELFFTNFKANDPKMDPLLRNRLYPGKKLTPFDKYFTKQLRLQKKMYTPDPKAVSSMDESANSFRVGRFHFFFCAIYFDLSKD